MSFTLGHVPHLLVTHLDDAIRRSNKLKLVAPVPMIRGPFQFKPDLTNRGSAARLVKLEGIIPLTINSLSHTMEARPHDRYSIPTRMPDEPGRLRITAPRRRW